MHRSSDTVFVERQLLARTNFTSVFLSFSIKRGIEEQTVFPERQLISYEGNFSLPLEITNSGTVFATQLSMRTIFAMLNVISAAYALFDIRRVFTNEQVINCLGFTSVFTDISLRHLVNITVVINEDIFNRNGRCGNRSSRITNSETVLPAMPNVISALCVLFLHSSRMNKSQDIQNLLLLLLRFR